MKVLVDVSVSVASFRGLPIVNDKLTWVPPVLTRLTYIQAQASLQSKAKAAAEEAVSVMCTIITLNKVKEITW